MNTLLLQTVGVVILVAGVIIAYRSRGHRNAGLVLGQVALFSFIGLALVMVDRITKVTIQGVGTIDAAVQQATIDATQVSAIRKRIEEQSATIDAIARQAADAKKLSDELATKSAAAQQKADSMDEAARRANKLLADVQQTAEFTAVAQAALSDDRAAFERLLVIGNNPKSQYSQRAVQAANAVLDKHATDSGWTARDAD